MAISFFCITPQMIQLFHECVEKKNYEEFYNHYKCDLEALSEKLKTVDLPKNWNSFYWGNRNLADFVMREARHQRIIDIYVFDGVKEYFTFYDRDCDVAKKYTRVYQPKNNRAKLVRPSTNHEGYYEAKNVFETSAESKTHNSMAHHGEHVYFTCSTVLHQRPYKYLSSSRHGPTNQSVHTSAHFQSKCHCSFCLKPSNDRVNHQFVKYPLEQNIRPHRNSGSTIRGLLPSRSSDELCLTDSHTGYKQQSSSNHGFDEIADSRDKLKTSTANIEQPKHLEELNREKFDKESNNIDGENRGVLQEAYKKFRSIYLTSVQNPRISETCEELRAGGCKDTSAHVENIEQSEDDKSVKSGVNNTYQYFVPPEQDSRMPPSLLTSNVLLDNQKNSKEAQTDSASLNSWSIILMPHDEMDILKPFEWNNTIRKSLEVIDEQQQPLSLGDLWSDLDKPEPSPEPVLRSDSSVDRGLEDWKRYSEDIKQHTTNAFIDTVPLEPKISEKVYSEDQEENATINEDFYIKFQKQTERNQEELRRKREERAARRREHEEELSKMRQESKQKYLMFFNCLGLKLRFEEQEDNWKEWIIGCRQCIDKLLELFNQFVSEIRKNNKGLRKVDIEDKADLETEISFLLKDIINTYNSLEDSFEQLTNLESRFEDVMFIKVLKKCIADLASRLPAAYAAAEELSEHASQDNFQTLQNTFDDLTPSLIYSTLDLSRICKDNSYSGIYENVQFPNIPLRIYDLYALESCEMDQNGNESTVDPKAQPMTSLADDPMSNVNKLHNSQEPALPLEIKNESGVEDATKQATKLQEPVLEDFGVDRKREERAERRRKLEEELRKLDEEDNEQLAVVSTFEGPELKNPENSLRQEESVPNESSKHLEAVLQPVFLKPQMLYDMISDSNSLTTSQTAGPSSESHLTPDLTPHLAEIEQEPTSTDSEISEKESEEDDFEKLIQEQAAHHRKEMEKIKRKRAAQKKEFEEINRKINTMTNIIHNSS